MKLKIFIFFTFVLTFVLLLFLFCVLLCFLLLFFPIILFADLKQWNIDKCNIVLSKILISEYR